MRYAISGASVIALATLLSSACDARDEPAVVRAATPPSEARGQLFPPDDLGALEAPDRAQWQQPDRVMDALNIADGSHVADLRAGGGWFAAYLARRVGPNGVVYAEDTQPAMIGTMTRKVKSEGLTNVVPILGAPNDPHLPAGLHAVLLVDAYAQLSDPVALLGRAAASLAPGGRIGIVDFKNDGAGGPGPRLEQRIAPEAVVRDARLAGLTLQSEERFLRYQYVLVFTAIR